MFVLTAMQETTIDTEGIKEARKTLKDVTGGDVHMSVAVEAQVISAAIQGSMRCGDVDEFETILTSKPDGVDDVDRQTMCKEAIELGLQKMASSVKPGRAGFAQVGLIEQIASTAFNAPGALSESDTSDLLQLSTMLQEHKAGVVANSAEGSDIERRAHACKAIASLAKDESYGGVLKSLICCHNWSMIEKVAQSSLDQAVKSAGAAFLLRDLASHSGDIEQAKDSNFVQQYKALSDKCIKTQDTRNPTLGASPISRPPMPRSSRAPFYRTCRSTCPICSATSSKPWKVRSPWPESRHRSWIRNVRHVCVHLKSPLAWTQTRKLHATPSRPLWT